MESFAAAPMRRRVGSSKDMPIIGARDFVKINAVSGWEKGFRCGKVRYKACFKKVAAKKLWGSGYVIRARNVLLHKCSNQEWISGIT